MSQKTEKPILSGQRIKTRKRDEKEKYDPTGFRDLVIAGLDKTGRDPEALFKFLDGFGSKQDYRRYGEALFDILIAGGLLVPGGSIALDGEKPHTESCIFCASSDMESMRNFEQIFIKIMRRYKYLEKMFEDEMKKVLVFLKGFDTEQRIKLARMTALWIGNGSVPPSVLLVLINDHLIKDNMALDFLIEVFITYKQEKGMTSLTTALKRGQIEGRLMEFCPSNRRTEEYFFNLFIEKDLSEIVNLHKAQASLKARKDLAKYLEYNLGDDKPLREITTELREMAQKENIPDHEIVVLIWTTVMSRTEWNKKEELVAEQAVKHLKGVTQLLGAFTTTPRAELALLLKCQEFCYENMNFMKAFQKIVVLLYKTDCVSEEVILKWYNEAHSAHASKGKMMFVEQMKKFVEWLQNAEEESGSGEDED